MTIAYQDQYSYANDRNFTSRVSAGMFAAAIAAFALPALADPVQQAQRMSLAHQIAINVTAFNSLFSWLCISQADVNTTDDLTDAKILNTITTLFDAVALNVIPPTAA